MQKISHFTTEEIFNRLFTNKSKTNYWRYITELRQRKTSDIYEKATELANAKDVNEKVIGIDILAQFGYPRKYSKQTLKTYFNLLKSENSIKVVSSALYGIGHNNENLTTYQINFICNYHTHKSATIRYSLTFALSGIENNVAIDTLIKLSKDKDSDIRDWATFGIGSQIELDNEAIREALFERLSDPDDDTKKEAILGLARRKDKRVKDLLKIELDNANNLSSPTLEAVEAFGDIDFIPLIEAKILKNRNEQTINEDWLIDSLEKLKENNNDS